MEFSWILVLLISSILLFITLFVNLLKRNPPKNLPPGPPKLPIIGNLHQLSSKNTLPHRRLAELARVYGPIMHLQLGEIPTVVISSPETAKEVLKTHDWVFCNRPILLMAQVVYKNYSDIALSPYNEYWREVRKIATLELFTARRVLEFRPFREEAIMDFIKSLLTKAKEGSVIDLTTELFSLSFDITLRLSMNQKAKDGEEFRKLIAEISELITGFSINDLYPSLKFISSISGMNRKLKSMVKKLDMLMDPIIEQHIHDKRQRKKDGDLVDVLLKYYKDEDDQHHANQFSLTKDNIKTIIFELFGAGGETSSTTMDWAFSELIRNPIVMKKAQNEVRQVLQKNKIMIDEADLEKLKYLKLIIKETLRLHPPLPCLIPRESMRKCEIGGYDIPSKTRVLINVWAIGRDIKCWKEPESFNPERFDGCLIDYKGTYFELIPFGAGRRMCPGIGLGVATIELVMAMLLYHFDWKLPDGIKDEDVDMDEVFGIMGRRKTNLQLIPLLHPISGFHINK